MRRIAQYFHLKSFAFCASMVITLLGMSPSPGLFAQVLEKTHPKYQKVWTIYQNIANAIGGNQLPPELVVARESRWLGAGYEYQPRARIILQERLLDACLDHFGEEADDALAVILSHELAHAYKAHKANTSFAAQTKNLNIDLEIEADYFGTYYGSLAGYNTLHYLDLVLDLIYELYELPEQLEGYPSKSQRYTIVEEKLQELSTLAGAYQVGQLLFIRKEYQLAADCFHFIAQSFPSREVFNNQGVSYLALAMNYAQKEDRYYAYPFELDPGTRLVNINSRNVDQSNSITLEKYLRMAKKSFEQAIRLDPNYLSAHINLACVHTLEDNAYSAIGRINELENKGITLSGNAYLIRAIGYSKIGENGKAETDFELARKYQAFKADYNAELFHNQTSTWGNWGEQLKTEVNNWVNSWWQEDENCTPNKEKRIGNFSFLNLYEQIEQQASINKIPGAAIKFFNKTTGTAEGTFIRYAGEAEDHELYIIRTRPNYLGSTQSGIQIGSRVEELLNQYCKPDYMLNSAGNHQFYVYEKQQVIFEIASGKIKSWSIFRI